MNALSVLDTRVHSPSLLSMEFFIRVRLIVQELFACASRERAKESSPRKATHNSSEAAVRNGKLTLGFIRQQPTRTLPVSASSRTHCTTALPWNLFGTLMVRTEPRPTTSGGTSRPNPFRLKSVLSP